MGSGIAAMHYIGMAAMQMPASPSYDVPLGITSVLIAIGASTVALWMMRRDTGISARACAATAMGFAIAGMHYTAMAAASWGAHRNSVVHTAHDHTGLGQAGLAFGVAIVTFLVLFLGFVAALLDRRFAALAEREARIALRESEGRLQALTDNLPSGMVYQITMRRDGSERRFSYVSRSCERLTGIPDQAILADPALLYATILPEDRAPLAAAEQAAIRDLKPFEFDTRFVPINKNEVRWCHLASAPRETSDGSLVWDGLLVDVTEHRCIEAALREQLRVNRAITDNAAVALFIMDENQKCVFMNPAAERLTGYTVSEVQGRSLHDVLHHTRPDGSHYPAHECPIGHAFPKQAQAKGEEIFVHKNGSFYPIAYTASPIRHEETGAPVGTIVEVRDISVERAAQAELRRNQAELERLVEERTAELVRASDERRLAEEAARQAEKLAALGQLTGGVAHDFNNILQVVTSGAALLKRASMPEAKRAEILDSMIEAGKNARELTGRLLAFARQQALRPELIDVGARLVGMSELLRQTLGARIDVETDIEDSLWRVSADVSQLEIAILNLAVNARDAMPEGGKLTIQARNVALDAKDERKAGDYVCIAIKDTGVGIPPHIRTRVLEPFFTTKEAGRGTGLGLPQVHGFAKQSGGDLSIESEMGQGTAVFFHLPRASAASEAESGGVCLSRSQRDVLQGVGKTVLVVEDNPGVAVFASDLLKDLGYRTVHAADAAEALAVLTVEEQVNVVFSDVMMPGEITGIGLAAALRNSHPHVAIVLATGYSEELVNGRVPEGIEILSKPYHPDELAAALGRALARVANAQEAVRSIAISYR
jgi:PAS domain S-box-containing protein